MKSKIVFSVLVLPSFILLLGFSYSVSIHHPSGISEWVVPESAKSVKNPSKATAENVKSGKLLYDKHCKSCHGGGGKGDGTKAKSLTTSCGDFTTKVFQGQTDGSIFYKIREGRTDMPSFKKKIPEVEELWSIVNYMRSFAPVTSKVEEPKPKVVEKKDTSKNEVKKVVVKPVTEKKDSATTARDSIVARERSKIEMLLKQYENALNTSDTLIIAALYTVNGIYIPLHTPTVVGADSIQLYFRKFFRGIKITTKFSIDEIEQIGDLALVRATSKGSLTTLGSSVTIADDNRHLFFLKKIKEEWKIYRYMSN